MQLHRPRPAPDPASPRGVAERYADIRQTAFSRPLSIVIASAILFGAAAGMVSILLPKTYEASTTLLIGLSTTGSDPGYQDLLASQLLAQTYAELATTRPILSAVAAELELKEAPEELRRSVSVEAAGLNPLVRVIVRGGDPDRVAAIANELARQLIEWNPDQGSTALDELTGLKQTLATIDAQVTRAEKEADDLQELGIDAPQGALQGSLSRLASLLSTRAALLQLVASTSSDSVRVVEPAIPPAEASQSGIVLNVAASALIAALVAAGVLFAASSSGAASGQTARRD